MHDFTLFDNNNWQSIWVLLYSLFRLQIDLLIFKEHIETGQTAINTGNVPAN